MVITYGNSLERSVCLNNPSTTLLNSVRWNYVNRKQIVFFIYTKQLVLVALSFMFSGTEFDINFDHLPGREGETPEEENKTEAVKTKF